LKGKFFGNVRLARFVGMHERAAAISGTLTVDSSVGEGAIITLQIPFAK
jgi:signal transduction histidine kinase